MFRLISILIVALVVPNCVGFLENVRLWTEGDDPPMRIKYVSRDRIDLYTKLSCNGRGDGRGVYYCGTAYIANELSPDEKARVIRHEWLHHCGMPTE